MFKDYQLGDCVTWFAGENKVRAEITERRDFHSFKEMLEAVGYKKLVPEAVSLEAAVSLYDSIPGYTEKARNFGVVSLGLKVIPNDLQHQSGYSSQNSGGEYRYQNATPGFRK